MDIILFVPVIKDINEYKGKENHYVIKIMSLIIYSFFAQLRIKRQSPSSTVELWNVSRTLSMTFAWRKNNLDIQHYECKGLDLSVGILCACFGSRLTEANAKRCFPCITGSNVWHTTWTNISTSGQTLRASRYVTQDQFVFNQLEVPADSDMYQLSELAV